MECSYQLYQFTAIIDLIKLRQDREDPILCTILVVYFTINPDIHQYLFS